MASSEVTKKAKRKRKEAEANGHVASNQEAEDVPGVSGTNEQNGQKTDNTSGKKKRKSVEGVRVETDIGVEENGEVVTDVDAKNETKGEKKNKKKKDKEKKETDSESTKEEDNNLAEETPAEINGKKKKNKNKKMKEEKKEKESEEEVIDVTKIVAKGLTDGVIEPVKGEDRWKNVAISVSGRGSDDPKLKPLKKFSEADLPKVILDSFGNFSEPSPIQAYSWPVLRAGRDLIGIAQTGSGKTLAFGVPALTHVLEKRKLNRNGKGGDGPICLMMAPTRELAQQITEVLDALGKSSNASAVCVCGGVPKGPQKGALRQNPAMVIATPGRLLDLLEEGFCSLSNISYVVLDEADRMLDLGFEPSIRAILSKTPKVKQTVMLSATWPPAVGQLASEFVKDPIKVTVGSKDLTANHDVTQIVEVVEDRMRDSRLDTLLRDYHKSRKNRVLVFVLYKKEAVRVERMLSSRGWTVGAVHGDKGQADRTRAVQQFKSGAIPLLIATDVAARGLDIPDVEYVINYSFPLTTEDYVHRIGRTGRAGRKGIAHTFFTSNDKPRAGELSNVLREAGQVVPEDLLKFGTAVKKKESKLYGAHFREISEDAPKATKITFADSDED